MEYLPLPNIFLFFITLCNFVRFFVSKSKYKVFQHSAAVRKFQES